MDGTGDALSSSPYFNTGAAPSSSFRGAFILRGPVIRDSSQFVFGLEGQRLEIPTAQPLAAGVEADSIVALAQDSFHVGLNNYLQPRVATTDALTTFGGLTLRLSSASDLLLQARYSTETVRNPDLALALPPSLGASLDDRDFLGGATLRSSLSSNVSQELQAGVQFSTRTYDGSAPPATEFVDVGTSVGSDPGLPQRGKLRSHDRAS